MKNYCAINGKPVRWHVIGCHALCFRGRDANGCSNWKVLSSRNLQTCNVMGDRTRYLHGLTSYHLFKPFYTMDTVIMICIQQQHFLSVTLKSMPQFFSHYVLPPFGSMDNSQLRNADHGVTDTRIVLLSAKYRQLRFFNAIF